MSRRVSKKGQVTIPKVLRDRLGIGLGSHVRFEVSAGGEVVLRPVEADRFDRMVGTLKTDMTTDEIMALLLGDSGT
jgi:AbrB family looped-hinge helix DNA binding protein